MGTGDTTNTRELPKVQGQRDIIVVGSGHISGMSDPRGGSDNDRDTLTGWTLVDREGTPEPHDPQDEEGNRITGAGAVEELEEEGSEQEEEDESGCGMEEDEGEGELAEELIHMGQHVQEVKGDADVESLASTTDISVLDEDKEIKDTAAMTGLK